MSRLRTGRTPAAILALAALLLACSDTAARRGTQEAPPAPAAPPEAAVVAARGAADAVMARVKGLLETELAAGGYAGAVEACAELAQQATREEAERAGLAVRRVSLRWRNPADAPDAFERAALERLEIEAKAGALPVEVIEVAPATAGNPAELHYLRPIVVAPLCLGCHGAPADLAPGVAEALARRFPADSATGYAAGDLRGAVSVRVPLPEGAS
jgi:hypothetical protein